MEKNDNRINLKQRKYYNNRYLSSTNKDKRKVKDIQIVNESFKKPKLFDSSDEEVVSKREVN